MVNQYVDIVIVDVFVLRSPCEFIGPISLAIKDGKIYAIDEFINLKHLICSKTIVLNLKNYFVLPSFIDSHMHLLDLALTKVFINLKDIKSIKDIPRVIYQYLSQNSNRFSWVIGYGWDQNNWQDFDSSSFPTHHILSEYFKDIPICLKRIDEHCIWVNDYAMRMCGINKDTPDPSGGKIIRDTKGIPTGVFIDNAINLIYKHIPELSDKEKLQALKTVQKDLFSYGITTINDAFVRKEDLKFYDSIFSDDEIQLRFYGMLNGADKDLLELMFKTGPIINKYNKFNLRTIKLFIDGALGSRGAALIKPYHDVKLYCGLMILDESYIYNISKTALHYGFQIAVHAIGDRANHVLAQALVKLFNEESEKHNHRFRVEHAQVLSLADIRKYSKYKVIASIQPIHYATDYLWAIKRLGKYRFFKKGYLWNTLLKEGVKIILGTDAPIAPLNPFVNIYFAISRDYFDKEQIISSLENKEKISLKDAFKAITINAAYANFAEDYLGTIDIGKYADLIIMKENIFNISKKDLIYIQPLVTISQGKIVFRNL